MRASSLRASVGRAGHREGDLTGRGLPGDRAVLEIRLPPAGDVHFSRDRITERAGLPAELLPLVANRAEHLVSAGGFGPVDRAALEDVVAALHVGRLQLVG